MRADAKKKSCATLTIAYVPVNMHCMFSSMCRMRSRDMSLQMRMLIREFNEKGTDYKFGSAEATPTGKRTMKRHMSKLHYKTIIIRSIPTDMYIEFQKNCDLWGSSVAMVSRCLIKKFVRVNRESSLRAKRSSV